MTNHLNIAKQANINLYDITTPETALISLWDNFVIGQRREFISLFNYYFL